MTDFKDIHFMRYDDLPDVSLYVDQLLDTLEDMLKPFEILSDKKLLTKSMVNNYVKLNLVSPPEKKRYGKKQLAQLMAIALFKQVFSIEEIELLFKIQSLHYETAIAYDYLMQELENALSFEFLDGKALPLHASHETEQTKLVRAMTLALASKLFVQSQLE